MYVYKIGVLIRPGVRSLRIKTQDTRRTDMCGEAYKISSISAYAHSEPDLTNMMNSGNKPS